MILISFSFSISCYGGLFMINSVNDTLAQQIVDTVKDVCGYDINFIRPDGSVFASTDQARIGTFHEIGRQSAVTGDTIEVDDKDSFAGTQHGINLPVYHNGKILAVIGITGSPDEVRKYAYLAERITSILIREQELSAFSRSQADKRQFIVTALTQQEKSDPDYLADCLKEYDIDLNSLKRFILIQINPEYDLINLSLLEQKISRLFAQAGIRLFAFRRPRKFLAVTEEKDFVKNHFLFQEFAQKNKDLIKISVGRSEKLFRLYTSYDSSRTALKSLSGSEENFAVFDDLTLELILSSVDENSKKEFLQKTINSLSAEELAIIKAYFSEDMSLAGTCAKLYLHKNTLQYKLNHIYKKCGLNPRRFRDAVLLYLALELAPSTPRN